MDSLQCILSPKHLNSWKAWKVFNFCPGHVDKYFWLNKYLCLLVEIQLHFIWIQVGKVNNLISRDSTQQRGEITDMKMCWLNKYFCFNCNTSALIIQILLFWSHKYSCFDYRNTSVLIVQILLFWLYKYFCLPLLVLLCINMKLGLNLRKYSKHRQRGRGKYHLKHTQTRTQHNFFDNIW